MSTHLKTECPQCHRKLNVSERHLGKNVKCPSCQHKWTLHDFALSGEHSIDKQAGSLQSLDDKSSDDETVKKTLNKNTDKSIGKLGRFEMKEALGGGAFGIVYRSFDPILGRSVALKIPRFESEDTSKTQRFLTEAHAAANLKHPNIVAVYESGEENGRPYIASEYVKGKPLSQKIKSNPPDFNESAFLVRLLADAIFYAHNEGVIHRDIKPDNIMVGEKNRPQIMDFGLAKLTDEESQMTGEGNIIGTPAYMSPEQARGDIDQIGPKSDQYSLGVILFELLTGERPYQGAPHAIIAQLISEKESPDALSQKKSVPRDLSAICRRSMEKDPEKRYSNCEEMTEDLSRWLSGLETIARPLSYFEKYKRWYRKNRTLARLWITVAGLFLMLLVFASVDYGRTKIQLEDTSAELVEEGTDRIEAQRNLAMNEFERGRNLCESGELNHGLLWLANSLDSLSPEMADLERPIRHYISSQYPLVHHLEVMIPHTEVIRTLAISPDGKLLITGTGSINEFDRPSGVPNNMKFNAKGQVLFWDLESGKKIPNSISHDTIVTKVAFSPDGKIAVSASVDKTVKIIDPSTGKEIHEPIIHPHAVIGAVFNHDGSLLATGCLDENVRLWNTTTWEQVGPALRHQRTQPEQGYNSRYNKQPILRLMAFTQDGKYLLVRGEGINYPFVKIWEISTGKEIEYPASYLKKRVEGMTPDGNQFVVSNGSRGFQFTQWQLPDQRESVYQNEINLGVMASNKTSGLLVIGGSNRSVFVYDPKFSAKMGQFLQHDSNVNAVDISRDGKIAVSGGDDKLVKVWRIAQDNNWGQIILHTKFTAIKYFPNGNRFLTGDSTHLSDVDIKPGEPGDRTRIWNSETLEKVAGPFGESGGNSSIDISLNEKMYARGNWYSVILKSVDDGKRFAQFKHPGRVTANCFINNDQVLLTGCDDGKLRFWDLDTKSQTGESLNHGGRITSLTLSPDKKYILSTSSNGTARLWDLKTGEAVSDPISHPKNIECGSFHPDGNYFATGCNNGTIYFWSVPDGKPVKTPIYNFDRNGKICMIEFHPDGQRILIAGTSKGAQIWDLDSLLPSSRLMMEGTWLRNADLSPDGRTILVSNYSLNDEGYEIQLKKMGQPIQGTPAKIKSIIEHATGMKLKEDGELKVLTFKEWSQGN